MAEIICIVCPKGCHLSVNRADEQSPYTVTGNECKRGEVYGVKELTNPTRVLTTTIKIEGAMFRRLPVVTKGAIPKGWWMEAMAVLNQLEVSAPVTVGQVIVEDFLGTGIQVVASRTLERV